MAEQRFSGLDHAHDRRTVMGNIGNYAGAVSGTPRIVSTAA
jgi:hypothetical protein